MANINPVLAAAKKQQALATTTQEQTTQINSQITALTDESASVQIQIGVNNALATSAKTKGELLAQQAIQKAKQKLGLDIDGTSDQLSGLIAESNAQYNEKQAALDRIKAKESVNWWEDPIGWVVNQFTISDDINTHNIADAKLAAAESRIDTITKQLTDQAIAQNASAATLTQASVDAVTQNQKLLATVQANQSKLSGLTANLNSIQAVLSAGREAFSTVMSVFGAQQQQEQQAISLRHVQIAEESLALSKKKERLQELSDQNLINTIKLGRQSLYGEKASFADLNDEGRAQNILAEIRSGKPISPQLLAEFRAGLTAAARNGIPSIGSSPAGAYQAFVSAPVQLSSEAEKTKALIYRAVGSIEKDPNFAGEKDPVKISEAINKKVTALVTTDFEKVQPGDRNNVANIPSIKDLSQHSAVVKNSPFYQKVLLPAQQAGISIDDPNIVIPLGIKALQKKEITYAEFLDYSTIIAVGMETNNRLKRFADMGISAPKTYNVSIKESPDDLFNNVRDISKPDVLGKVAVKWMASAGTVLREVTPPPPLTLYNPLQKLGEKIGSAAAEVPTADQRHEMMFPEFYKRDLGGASK